MEFMLWFVTVKSLEFPGVALLNQVFWTHSAGKHFQELQTVFSLVPARGNLLRNVTHHVEPVCPVLKMNCQTS